MMGEKKEEVRSYGKTMFGHFNDCYTLDYYDGENKLMNEPCLKKPCIRKKPGYISLEGRRIRFQVCHFFQSFNFTNFFSLKN